MHYPRMIRANKEFESGILNKNGFKKELSSIKESLETGLKCLETEADGTKEADTAKSIVKALVGIKELIFFSDFL